MIELKQAQDDTSISISAGSNSFIISFCEVPRAQDNEVRSHQRVHDPYGGREGCLQPVFPFTIYSSPVLKDSRALAIKDDKAFAIRMSGSNSSESAFKVKVSVGGVNIIQNTATDGKETPPQDYFVVSEQEWIWGTQVGKDTARQFRVFGRRRERLSLPYQLHKNNLVKEVEIQITSRRPAPQNEPDTTSECSTLAGSSDEPSDQQQFVPFASSSSSNRRPDSSSIDNNTSQTSPHEMVIGTGGLIRQVIAQDKHPEYWTSISTSSHDDDNITLKFKILNPKKPKYFKRVTGLPLGNPGGNWKEMANPARKFFGRRAPLLENPDEEIRGDIKSPEEIEGDAEVGVDVDVDSDLDSGVAMGRASDTGEEEEEEEDDDDVSSEERNQFEELMGEARSQPREPEPTNEKRKKKEKREKKKDERRPGVMHIMVLNRAGPVNAHGRRRRWRKFLEAMRRVLTPGQWAAAPA